MFFHSNRPLIGVSPRWEEHPPSVEMPEQLSPTEGVAKVFNDAIIEAGGMPVMLPITTNWQLIGEYVDMCDGITLPGGHDVSPARWGSSEGPDNNPSIYLCEPRDEFEFLLVERAIAAHKPLFATCRGAQLLNVAFGGTLCMDVPHFKPREGMTLWRHHQSLNYPCHDVMAEPDSLLARAMGATHAQVNSAHHCCVERLGTGVVLSGVCSDGVPEAIEVPSEKFVLGVQWHPEYTWQTLKTDFNLWKAFVAACK